MIENREVRKELCTLQVLTQAIYFHVCSPSQPIMPMPDATHGSHFNQHQPAYFHLNPPAVPPPSHAPPITLTPTLPSATNAPPATQPDALQGLHVSHSLMVRDVMVVYDREHLIAPPHRDYASDIELLATDWEHFTLTLHPGQLEDIGVKFWKQLYRGTKYWARLRKPYSTWTVRTSPHLLCFHSLTLSTTVSCSCARTIPDSRPILGRILDRWPPINMDAANPASDGRAYGSGQAAGSRGTPKIWKFGGASCLLLHKSEHALRYVFQSGNCTRVSKIGGTQRGICASNSWLRALADSHPLLITGTRGR